VESIKPFDDVRSKDLSKLDLSSRKGLIATLAFDQQTVWPEQAKMPPGSDPKRILADAMNSGLGVRDMNYFWVNDMSCRSTMTSSWFVNHVVIRSTGAP
jgi:hypothetical protein